MQTLTPSDALQVWFALLDFPPLKRGKTLQQTAHVLKQQLQRIRAAQRNRQKQQFQKLRFWRPLSDLIVFSDSSQTGDGWQFIIDPSSPMTTLQRLILQKIREDRRIPPQIRDNIQLVPLQIDLQEKMFHKISDFVVAGDKLSQSLAEPIDVSNKQLWLVNDDSVLFSLEAFKESIENKLNFEYIFNDVNPGPVPYFLKLFKSQNQFSFEEASLIRQIIQDCIVELYPS